MSNASTNVLDLATVKKWVKAQEKQFKQLKKQLEKADDIGLALKQLDVTEPALRSLRNKARKLQREFPAAARFRKKVLREVDTESKRFAKLLALV
jgi:phage-related tail protein